MLSGELVHTELAAYSMGSAGTSLRSRHPGCVEVWASASSWSRPWAS